nr:MAG TPA: hypothetical protein [Caudoviricetes sp.]
MVLLLTSRGLFIPPAFKPVLIGIMFHRRYITLICISHPKTLFL